MSPRLRSAAGRWVIALVSSLIALAVVEAGLRLTPSARRYYVWPPYTTVVFPAVPDVFSGITGMNRFTTSSEGIRGREFGSDEDEYRILAIGGSATEGLRVDDSEVWPAIVEQRLGRTADGRQTWVGNVGRSGLSSRDHVVQVEYLTEQYPTIAALLVLVGVNDLTVALAQGQDYAAPPPLTDPEVRRTVIERAFAMAPGQFTQSPEDGPLGTPLPAYKNTAVWSLLRRVWRIARVAIWDAELAQDIEGENLESWRKRRQAASRILERLPDLTAALAEYRGNLRAIAELARARGRRLVLITQPTIWRSDLSPRAAQSCWLGGTGRFQQQQSPEYYSFAVLAEGMKAFNGALLDVGRELGVEVIDLAATVPKDESVFFDDAHFTENGQRIVATLVAEQLARTPPFRRE